MKSIKDQIKPAAESVGDLAEKYKNLDEAELNEKLMQNVAAAKRDGTFDASSFDDFYSFVSSSLDETAQKRLRTLIETIKRV